MSIKNELREMKERLKQIVERHEKLQNSYFWSPNKTASGRRASEKKYNDIYENKKLGIYAENRYRESCKNIYYKGIFYLDGKKTTVAEIKKLISALDYIC